VKNKNLGKEMLVKQEKTNDCFKPTTTQKKPGGQQKIDPCKETKNKLTKKGGDGTTAQRTRKKD